MQWRHRVGVQYGVRQFILINNPALGYFAEILDYPTENLGVMIQKCKENLGDSPKIRNHLEKLEILVDDHSQGQIEEIYTEIFDMNPSLSLYIGYHLLGESYKRSSFMIKLIDHYKEIGFESSLPEELPDHLAIMLRFLSLNQNEQLSRELITDALLPVLSSLNDKIEKLTKESSTENMQDAYFSVLQGLQLVLQQSQNILENTGELK